VFFPFFFVKTSLVAFLQDFFRKSLRIVSEFFLKIERICMIQVAQ
jgi:hypothetical protein